MAAAQHLVKTGLREKGYVYVNLDDCWHDKARDPNTGELRPDPLRFPSGMKALGDYLHSQGLLFGIYTDRGSRTCAGMPGSFGHEMQDARTFAAWGVDYVKEDNCHAEKGPNDLDTLFQQFSLFRDALNQTGRQIFFSVCGGGDQRVFTNLSYFATDPRGGTLLANAWRVSSDCIEWKTCRYSAGVAGGRRVAASAGPGGFNDPDMLLGTSLEATRRLSPARSRTQFSLAAILMAPLLIGARIQDLDDFDLETYGNLEVLAVNQDLLAQQGFRLTTPSVSLLGTLEVWGRPLQDSSWAMLFLNDDFFVFRNVTCDQQCWYQLPFPTGTRLAVRNVWTHGPSDTPIATAGIPYTVRVPPYGASAMFIFSPLHMASIAAGTAEIMLV